jgi:phage repressor protein C with HTH and peptisase S24 domain
MDTVWFQQALERAGVTQADLARHLRLAPSAISRMLKGERQIKLLEAAQIANFLGVPAEAIVQHGSEPGAPAEPAAARRPGRPRVIPPAPRGAERVPPPPAAREPIPVRSAARGGVEQEMYLADGPIGYTPRPANLAGVRGAYAIYMVGDSMEPRYEPGWLLHVNPFKPPMRGRDVVVYKRGNAVLIKQFLGWDGDTLVLRQLNPPLELRFPRAEVLEFHLIVGTDQEG